jgi:hypothetical protein
VTSADVRLPRAYATLSEDELRRIAIATVNLLLFAVGMALYGERTGLGEPVARTYCIASCLVALLSVVARDPRLGNWMMWVQFMYFAFYALGSLIGVWALAGEQSVLDYPTTFSNGLGVSARVSAYLVSGATSPLLTVFYLAFPPRPRTPLPAANRGIEEIGLVLIIFSMPFVAAVLISDAVAAWSAGYIAVYSAAFRESRTVGALSAVWTNANWLGFILFFSSRPPERRFRLVAILFLAVAFLDSLKGARILFIIPILFLLWYRAVAYQHHFLSRKLLFVVAAAGAVFVYALEVVRQREDFATQSIVRFAVFSVSKGQYGLALYLDNKDVIDEGSAPYWSAPLRFPVTYALNRDGAVGQSESSAAVRDDLGHVMSSRLNYGAYLQGAGTGSNMVAEAFQYGPFVLPVLILMYYLFYRWFFQSLGTRLMLGVSPFVFQHLSFTPRDSLFPNMWTGLKAIVALSLVFAAHRLVAGLFARSRPTSSPHVHRGAARQVEAT